MKHRLFQVLTRSSYRQNPRAFLRIRKMFTTSGEKSHPHLTSQHRRATEKHIFVLPSSYCSLRFSHSVKRKPRRKVCWGLGNLFYEFSLDKEEMRIRGMNSSSVFYGGYNAQIDTLIRHTRNCYHSLWFCMYKEKEKTKSSIHWLHGYYHNKMSWRTEQQVLSVTTARLWKFSGDSRTLASLRGCRERASFSALVWVDQLYIYLYQSVAHECDFHAVDGYWRESKS